MIEYTFEVSLTGTIHIEAANQAQALRELHQAFANNASYVPIGRTEDGGALLGQFSLNSFEMDE